MLDVLKGEKWVDGLVGMLDMLRERCSFVGELDKELVSLPSHYQEKDGVAFTN